MTLEQKFRWRWFLVCSLSIPVAYALGQAIRFRIGFSQGGSPGWALGILLGLLAMGMVIGLAQGFLLRNKIPRISLWILISSLGWVLGDTIAFLVSNPVFSTIDLMLFARLPLTLVWLISNMIAGALGGALGGLLLGSLQWCLLRQKSPRAHQWVWTNSLSWALGHGLAGIMSTTFVGTPGLVLTWMVYGLVYGAMTGQNLIKMLSRPADEWKPVPVA